LNPANTDSSTIWHFHWTDSGQHLKSAFAIRFRNRNNGSNFSTVLGNEHFLGSVNNRAKDSAGFSAKLSESGLHKYEKYTLYFSGQASSNERALRGWRETNHGFQRWARMIPASWDWQKKSKNLASLLAEFLFLPCPIRAANAPVLIFSYPCSSE
jgi:hypothetical protein